MLQTPGDITKPRLYYKTQVILQNPGDITKPRLYYTTQVMLQNPGDITKPRLYYKIQVILHNSGDITQPRWYYKTQNILQNTRLFMADIPISQLSPQFVRNDSGNDSSSRTMPACPRVATVVQNDSWSETSTPCPGRPVPLTCHRLNMSGRAETSTTTATAASTADCTESSSRQSSRRGRAFHTSHWNALTVRSMRCRCQVVIDSLVTNFVTYRKNKSVEA